MTPDACRLVLAVALRGEGKHEVSHTQFRILLNHQGGDRRVGRALALAEELGWLARTPGGRGHSDRYEFSPPPGDTGYPDSPTESSTPKPDSPTEFGGAKGAVVAKLQDGVVVASNAREANLHPLDDSAVQLMAREGARLEDCRKPLKDYLRRRVPPERQRGYVGSVLSYLAGSDAGLWKTAGGQRISSEHWPGMVGTALNELLGGDEAFWRKGPGDPLCLKYRLVNASKLWGQTNGGSNGGGGAGTARGAAPGSSIAGERDEDTRFA